ncbi:hypothetical protein C942_02215 [Photobacterium marinum]|uniref:Uncharacterized protein n=2 Tax=Photobacterium marinum TaxID=1056511 RepID=L8JAR8_9GAMM|nr:hypothetical protein C942_02215 [Photobacterium marinum]
MVQLEATVMTQLMVSQVSMELPELQGLKQSELLELVVMRGVTALREEVQDAAKSQSSEREYMLKEA